MSDFINPNDFSNLANNFIKGAPGQGQAGYGYAAPVLAGQQGKQDAFQQLAMAKLRMAGNHQKAMSDIQNQIRKYSKDAMQANPLDYAGAALAGFNTLEGLFGPQKPVNENFGRPTY